MLSFHRTNFFRVSISSVVFPKSVAGIPCGSVGVKCFVTSHPWVIKCWQIINTVRQDYGNINAVSNITIIIIIITLIIIIITILLLSEHTPLERCCVHNMSPFVSSSGLSPGSREAKVRRAKVCLNCTEPSVARSSCWSLPVGWYLFVITENYQNFAENNRDDRGKVGGLWVSVINSPHHGSVRASQDPTSWVG